MQKEQGARFKRVSSVETSLSNYSEEHHVYYYSSFDLFSEQEAEDQFYEFTIFLQKISSELGNEWKNEARHLYWPIINHHQVFLHLMELWLQHHPPVNSQRLSKAKPTTFSPSFLAQFTVRMQQEAIKLRNNPQEPIPQPPQHALKAVALGFFMTANETWEELFQTQTPQKPDLFSTNGFFKQVSTSLQRTFKPLMVVTQKIETILGRKKRKRNQEMEEEECQRGDFENCYHQFRKTLDKEKQIERKMSDLLIEDTMEDEAEQSKVYEKKTFQESESPLQPGILGNIYSYVTDFLGRSPSWQVANQFVTQILDMNQVQMEEGTKVKVMRPAQDFYQKLVMVWLMLHGPDSSSNSQVSFASYLERLQASFFAESWLDKYLIPTRYFYERMRLEWDQIAQEQRGSFTERDVLKAFLVRVKQAMQSEWDTKIRMSSRHQ